MNRARAATVVAIALLIAAMAPAAIAVKGGPATVDVQLLSINDFHGNLEPIPSTSSSGRIGSTPAGGVEYLATHVRNLEATNPNTVVVSAGDLIGASTLL